MEKHGEKVSWKVMKKSWKIGLAQKVMESGQREKMAIRGVGRPSIIKKQIYCVPIFC